MMVKTVKILENMKGKLADSPKSVTVALPENEWLIEYAL